jgi:DNA-binding response OmpR family regulator
MRLFKPDLILVDWVMAPIDGIEFVRMVRMAKDSFNPYVPIIMLTGYTEVRRVEEARDVGVNEFLAKPISAKSLYMRIAKIIREPRPFVRTKTYFGPDRRRLVTREYKGKERRLSTIAAPKIEKMDPIPMPKSMMSGILQ